MSEYFLNPIARSFPAPLGLFKAQEYQQVVSFFLGTPATPLQRLRALASKWGVSDIIVKDESGRLGTSAFKILGVSYAVNSLLREGRLTNDTVLVCATEGNHGRAVARAAHQHRLNARIYMPADSALARREAIVQEGGEVVIVEGTYDDAVCLAADDAEINGYTIISDTSWAGYEEIPRRIMAGYTQLLDEVSNQLESALPPDLVLVQAGVGGLACAVVSWLCHRYGAQRPFTVACEPTRAACLLESARAGRPVALRGPFDTIMAGLRCGEVSPLTRSTISAAVDAFVSVDDEQCASAMKTLAHPIDPDPTIISGASGACGLAGLRAILQDAKLRPLCDAIGISVRSRILVINTEGATDPNLYMRVTGKRSLDD